MDEAKLLDTLRRIEALFAGATTLANESRPRRLGTGSSFAALLGKEDPLAASPGDRES